MALSCAAENFADIFDSASHKPQAVFVSPMKRCVQTAEILFPGKEQRIIRELSECDFGAFENRNYKELSGNADYQAWVDSGGSLPFPGGESREAFKERSLSGFALAVEECIQKDLKSAALVVHGGTIMNIMEEYGEPKRAFYEWHVGNGGGYEAELDVDFWKKGERILRVVSSLLV